jgi:hypothetical protein
LTRIKANDESGEEEKSVNKLRTVPKNEDGMRVNLATSNEIDKRRILRG